MDGERSAWPASGGFESAHTTVRTSSAGNVTSPLGVRSPYHAQA